MINYDKLNQFRVGHDFYLQKPEIVAKELLGKIICFQNYDTFLAGVIVETEAYLCKDDLSSHSARGKSERNSAMFMDGGTLYVYKIYGVHYCINVVTEKKDIGSAVLIRAIEPILGIEFMVKNRNTEIIHHLCKGPGNLAKAFGFNTLQNKSSLLSDELFISEYKYFQDFVISTTKRIGITKSEDLLLRFFVKDSKYVSGKKI
jgi:DNA-3-methyladenine glycosylase